MIVYKLFDNDQKFFYNESEVSNLSEVVDPIAYKVVECPLTGTLELMRLQ